jgi:hypothetical protein
MAKIRVVALADAVAALIALACCRRMGEDGQSEQATELDGFVLRRSGLRHGTPAAATAEGSFSSFD